MLRDITFRLFRSFLSTYSRASKPTISPPIRQARAAGSKAVIGRTPLREAHSACQKAAFSRPIGLMTPRPVITTRREDEAMEHRGLAASVRVGSRAGRRAAP